jgi:hypothetical protein
MYLTNTCSILSPAQIMPNLADLLNQKYKLRQSIIDQGHDLAEVKKLQGKLKKIEEKIRKASG